MFRDVLERLGVVYVHFEFIVPVDSWRSLINEHCRPDASYARRMLWIIFGVALACIAVERLWPANELPQVRAWWGRIVLVNAIQLGFVILTGLAWDRCFSSWSLFHLSEHCNDFTSGAIAYFISTFVYYWWHRYRHESQFFWRVCHKLHHSARRIVFVPSFYKRPVEIFLNSLLSRRLVYRVLGVSPPAPALRSLP